MCVYVYICVCMYTWPYMCVYVYMANRSFEKCAGLARSGCSRRLLDTHVMYVCMCVYIYYMYVYVCKHTRKETIFGLDIVQAVIGLLNPASRLGNPGFGNPGIGNPGFWLMISQAGIRA